MVTGSLNKLKKWLCKWAELPHFDDPWVASVKKKCKYRKPNFEYKFERFPLECMDLYKIKKQDAITLLAKTPEDVANNIITWLHSDKTPDTVVLSGWTMSSDIVVNPAKLDCAIKLEMNSPKGKYELSIVWLDRDGRMVNLPDELSDSLMEEYMPEL